MATRLNQSKVATYIQTELENIRAGLSAALSAGIIVQMPEEVEFNYVSILDGVTMQEVVTETGSDTGTETGATSESSSNSESRSSSMSATDSTSITRAYNTYTSS